MPDYLAFEDWIKALKKFDGFEDLGLGLALKAAKVEVEKDPKKAKSLFETVVEKAELTKKKNAGSSAKDGRAYVDKVLNEAKLKIEAADGLIKLRKTGTMTALGADGQPVNRKTGSMKALEVEDPSSNRKTGSMKALDLDPASNRKSGSMKALDIEAPTNRKTGNMKAVESETQTKSSSKAPEIDQKSSDKDRPSPKAPKSLKNEPETTTEKEVDTALLAELKQSAKRSRRFLLAIGERAALIVSRSLTSGHREEATTKSGGGKKFVIGEVTVENGILVFLLEKAPPNGLALRISKAIKSQTGKKMKLVVRGGGVQLDSATDQGELNVSQLSDAPLPDSSQGIEKAKSKAAWDQAWSQASQDAKTWSLYKTPAAILLNERMQAALKLAKQEHYEEALSALDLVDQSMSGLEAERNAWTALRQKVTDGLKQTGESPSPEVAELANAFYAAQGMSRKGEFAEATAAAEQVWKQLALLLGQDVAESPEPTETEPTASSQQGPIEEVEETIESEPESEVSDEVPLVAFTQARLRWDSARKQIQADVSKLQADLAQRNLTDFALLTAGVGRILEDFDASLLDTLDDALNAQDPDERRRHHQAALNQIATYQVLVNSDPLIPHVDAHPDVKTKIQSTLNETLAELASKLKG